MISTLKGFIKELQLRAQILDVFVEFLKMG